MTKKRIYWICQLAGWGTWGAFQVFLYSIANRFDSNHLVMEGLQVFYYILATHLFREAIIRWDWLNLRLARLIPRLVLSTLLLSVLNYAYLLSIQSVYSGINSMDFMVATITINVGGSWIVYFIWTIFYFTFHYVDRYNKSLKLEAQAKEAELNNLKSQLNPHFIFNALNSIRALVDENPARSKESITQLSHLLRNSLMSDRKKLISFNEELKTVMDYLALESIRYEERLSIKFNIDSKSGDFLVPPLMLQTLVENGIKHGIANLKSGGVIGITTHVNGKHLTLEIRNTGQLVSEEFTNFGLGLENTVKRLDLLYEGKASFNIANEDEKSVLTKIVVPKI